MNVEQQRKLLDIFDVVESADPAEICSECTELATIVDRYERKELIGAGGMKKVWRVYDRRTRATIAYAEPRDGLHPVFYDTLLEEAWRTASLSHPNIIKIHDTGNDGQPYFTMDLKRGDNIAVWKERSAPSQDECLDVFLKVCEAMIHAHSHNVLHLDLKPDNIQIEGHNEAIVCDWGAGGDLSGATPGYMPPELSCLEFCADERCDIYGLGAILYFLLTGEPPGEGNNAEEILASTQKGVRSPRTRFSTLHIPRALDQIVIRAMATNPVLRYKSANDLANDIRKFRRLQPTSDQQNKPITCSWLFYQRNQLVSNLTVLGSVALIIIGGWSLQEIRHYREEIQAQKNRAELAIQHVESAEDDLQMAQLSIDNLMKNHDSSQRNISAQVDDIAEKLKGYTIYRQPLETVYMLEQLAELSFSYVPDSILAWHQMAEVHFLKLNFSAVREIVSTRKPHFPLVWEVFSELPNRSYASMPQKPYDEIINYLKNRSYGINHNLVMRLLVYARAQKELSYEEAVTLYLTWADPAISQLNVAFDSNALTIEAVTNRTALSEILHMVNCEKIVLIGNWPLSLGCFYQSGAREMDISKRLITDDIKPLLGFNQLKSLTVKKGAYSQSQLQALRARMKVIEISLPQ